MNCDRCGIEAKPLFEVRVDLPKEQSIYVLCRSCTEAIKELIKDAEVTSNER